MTTKTKVLNFILACVSGTVLFLAIAEALFLIVDDISSGALDGRAESGWGILIALGLFLPIAVVAFFVFRASIKKYKQKI